MILQHGFWHLLHGGLSYYHVLHSRSYASKVDWNKFRPMILERIRNRSKTYPVRDLVPVAYEVLSAREDLIRGVSALLNIFPVRACKYCPEVHVGKSGHLIKTCHGPRHVAKTKAHYWVDGGIKDILVSVETYHLQTMFQDVIEHSQRFDFDRVPAVLELCHQAGAVVPDKVLFSKESWEASPKDMLSLSREKLKSVAQITLEAWERLRLGVTRLLLVYPAKVCKYCSEVHIGPSGHKARLCGIFKYEGWRGTHFWKKAEVDDLVPQKVVWHLRPQDPAVLLDNGRGYYGHAPAVVELCAQAGANVPKKYFAMMKNYGFSLEDSIQARRLVH